MSSGLATDDSGADDPYHTSAECVSSPSTISSSATAHTSRGTGPGLGHVELQVGHGEPLTDRKSTFQAHVASVHSMQEVRSSWNSEMSACVL